MVKVVNVTEEIKKNRAEAERIRGLAKEVFGDEFIPFQTDELAFYVTHDGNHTIHFGTDKSSMIVTHPGYLDLATSFAQRYEALFPGREITIKIDYSLS